MRSRFARRQTATCREVLEPGTGPWFDIQFSDTTFGIFEALSDVAARNADDFGPGGQKFLRSAELEEMLAYPAHVYRLDVRSENSVPCSERRLLESDAIQKRVFRY